MGLGGRGAPPGATHRGHPRGSGRTIVGDRRPRGRAGGTGRGTRCRPGRRSRVSGRVPGVCSSSLRRIATTSPASAAGSTGGASSVADRVGDEPAEAAGGVDDPGAGQGQPLPGLRRASEVVAEGVERHDQRARGAVGPEPGIDGVERARRRGRSTPSALSTRRTTSVTNSSFGIDRAPLGPAVAFVQEDEVEVAMVIQLAAAELAQADDRPARALAVAGRRGVPNAGHRRSHWSLRDLDHDRLGHVGQLAGHVADRLAAEDVAGADPDPLLVPEAEQDRCRGPRPPGTARPARP